MSDRVVVLTHRPATVKKIYNIDFEMENRTPLTCLQTNYDEEIIDGDLHCIDMYYYSKDLKKSEI